MNAPDTKKPRIGILTSLGDFSPAYSLTGIIMDQARSFRENGYDYDVLTLKRFSRHDQVYASDKLNVRYVLTSAPISKMALHERPTKEFQDLVKIFYDGDSNGMGYKEALEPYDIVITHDLMFLDTYLSLNQVIRDCIEHYPEKRWLHWIHSSPSHRPQEDEENPEEGKMCYPSTLRFSNAPNSLYVILNKAIRQDLARMLNTDNSSIRTVYNPRDIRDVLEFHRDSRAFIERYNLFEHFILQIYPFSTPRWVAKGVQKLLKIFGVWKELDIPARLVLVNAHCNQDKGIKELEKIKGYAVDVCGLEIGKDVIFTYDYAVEREKEYEENYPPEPSEGFGTSLWKAWKYSVPHKVVKDLVSMSNVFIFPSVSECCSLIQAEASVLGKFMVLNRDFFPMLEFCVDGVLSYEFTKYSPETHSSYYECVAREIISNFMNETSVLNATQARNETCNRDWIFKNQLEPLLYEGFDKHVES